ncbi:02a6d108-a1be-4110-b1c9-4dcf3e2be567 [Sclerotinia trifoliorum]|uniref:02a6d108-a1be-4110-b1c9-4dcf3e2be567 n=1 Tax=Sclerotinia trifoliorum TaxID=28548 RepID=A0A8H2VRD2_9HELO|nr:02a6d108-a1be-4110-b1c9-4dcf3e2be567 [Sclerotinia trifoliorum]
MPPRKAKAPASAAEKAPANVGVKRTGTSRISATATAPNPSKVAGKPATKVASTKVAPTKAAPAKATKAATTKAASKKVAPKKSKVASKKTREEDAESGEEEEEEEQTPAPKPVANRKRGRTQESEVLPVAKKLKIGVTINTPPVQRLDVYVFGSGENNELGLGAAKIDGKPPVGVKRPRYNPLLKGVTQIAVGGMHCVALTDDQRILTWGVSDGGSLGRDTSAYEAPAKDMDADSDSEDEDDIVLNPIESTPTAISTDFLDGRKVVQVLASDSVSFVLTEDGYVYGWGSFTGNDGTIGFTSEGATKASTERDGDLKKKLKIQAEPILIPGLKNIKSLARGSNHVLAIDNKGTVFTWGAWQQYQLGRRVSERSRFSALTPAPILKRCKAIAAGTYHSFAINQKDQVLAWGLNNFGQTGIADKAGENDALIPNPTVVKSLKGYKIAQLKGGLHHSIACTEDKEILVWGRCDYGQMGLDLATIDKESIITSASTGKPAILLKPTVVPSIKGNFVSAAIDNCIAIDDDGKAWSWGYGENYRTGLGSDETTWTPKVIENSAIKGKKMTFAGCGGQFSIIAGPEVTVSNGA